jgi:hypothetical protein
VSLSATCVELEVEVAVELDEDVTIDSYERRGEESTEHNAVWDAVRFEGWVVQV